MAILDFQKPDQVIMLNASETQGQFEFRPLEPGYGITIGNALNFQFMQPAEICNLLEGQRGVVHQPNRRGLGHQRFRHRYILFACAHFGTAFTNLSRAGKTAAALAAIFSFSGKSGLHISGFWGKEKGKCVA